MLNVGSLLSELLILYKGRGQNQEVSEMFKSIPSGSRPITAGVLLVLTLCFGSCSTKSQIVGRWSYNVTGIAGMPAAVWTFSSDNRCHWQETVSGADCTYTISDDGTVKISFSGGQRAEGKLDGGKLTLKAFGKPPVVLTKE